MKIHFQTLNGTIGLLYCDVILKKNYLNFVRKKENVLQKQFYIINFILKH